MLVGCKGSPEGQKRPKKGSKSKKLLLRLFWDTLYIFGGEEKKERCLKEKTFCGGENWRKKRREVFREGKIFLWRRKKTCGRKEQRRRTEGKHLEKEKCLFGGEGPGVSCK